MYKTRGKSGGISMLVENKGFSGKKKEIDHIEGANRGNKNQY